MEFNLCLIAHEVNTRLASIIPVHTTDQVAPLDVGDADT